MRIVGLRVRSGFAVGVLVQGDAAAWRVERRLDLPLTVGEGEYARFPYHPLIDLEAGVGIPASEQALSNVRIAGEALAPVFLALKPIDCAVIVAGSLLAPEKIGNPHMRTHAKEGQLFRNTVAAALQRCGIPWAMTGEKSVRAQAAQVLGLTEAHLRGAVTVAGRGLIKPWRTDEKLATFGALWKLDGLASHTIAPI